MVVIWLFPLVQSAINALYSFRILEQEEQEKGGQTHLHNPLHPCMMQEQEKYNIWRGGGTVPGDWSGSKRMNE